MNGQFIYRTMHLLETSNEERRNKVRIAISGQSIANSVNRWTHGLIDYLRRKYKYADIEFENFAVGGFSTQILWKKTHNDIKRFLPDLVILVVTGSHYDYEKAIQIIRDNSIAEMLLITNHYTGIEDDWADKMSFVHIPKLAEKYGLELLEIRSKWKQYFIDHSLAYSSVLTDEVHLNERGQDLMLEFVKQGLVYDSKWGKDYIEPVEIYEVGKDIFWENGVLQVSFNGNAVFAVIEEDTKSAATVLVNGQRPSETDSNYYHTPVYTNEDYWYAGGFLKLEQNKIPGEAHYTIDFTRFYDGEKPAYTFTMSRNGNPLKGEGSDISTLDGEYWSVDPDDFFNGYPIRESVPKQYSFHSKMICRDGFICTGSNGSSQNIIPLIKNLQSVIGNTIVITAIESNNVPNIKKLIVHNPLENPNIINRMTEEKAICTAKKWAKGEFRDQGKVKLQFMGDSITHGKGPNMGMDSHGSYRYPLWKKLIDNEINVQFVGTETENHVAPYVYPDYNGHVFDPTHQSKYGIMIREQNLNLPYAFAEVEVDIVIILLGDNDLREMTGDIRIKLNTMNDRMKKMIHLYRAENADIHIYLVEHFSYWEPFPEINQMFKNLAEEMNLPNSPIHTIETIKGWVSKPNSKGTCTVDWVHPNGRGDQLLADRIYNAIQHEFKKRG